LNGGSSGVFELTVGSYIELIDAAVTALSTLLAIDGSAS